MSRLVVSVSHCAPSQPLHVFVSCCNIAFVPWYHCIMPSCLPLNTPSCVYAYRSFMSHIDEQCWNLFGYPANELQRPKHKSMLVIHADSA